MTMTSRAGIFGLVLGALLMIGAEARAVTVSFIADGRFTGGDTANTDTYTDLANGITIRYETVLNQGPFTVFPTNVSFGRFITDSAASSSLVNVSSGFELDILQISPSGGSAQYLGTLTGQLASGGSQAWVQFDPSDLVRIIGLVQYEIVSADSGQLGRVDIPALGSDQSSIVGRLTAIPEPSAIVLVGLGAVAPLALTLRRRIKARTSA